MILPLFHGHLGKQFIIAFSSEVSEMTKKTKTPAKGQRTRYSEEFKKEALLRAAKDGVPMAARDLGLHPTQLYGWRGRARQQGEDTEAQRIMQSEAARLKREVARLEEENAFLKKAAAYFAKQPK